MLGPRLGKGLGKGLGQGQDGNCKNGQSRNELTHRAPVIWSTTRHDIFQTLAMASAYHQRNTPPRSSFDHLEAMTSIAEIMEASFAENTAGSMRLLVNGAHSYFT